MFSLCKTAILGQHIERLFYFFFPWKTPPRCCFPLLFLEGRYFLTAFVANLALSPYVWCQLVKEAKEKLDEQRQDSPRGVPEPYDSGVVRYLMVSPVSCPPGVPSEKSRMGTQLWEDMGCMLGVLMYTPQTSCQTFFLQAGDWAGCFGIIKKNQSWTLPPYFPVQYRVKICLCIYRNIE